MGNVKLKLNYDALDALLLPVVEAKARELAARASVTSGETYEIVSGMNVKGRHPRPHAGVGGSMRREIQTDALQKALGGGA